MDSGLPRLVSRRLGGRGRQSGSGAVCSEIPFPKENSLSTGWDGVGQGSGAARPGPRGRLWGSVCWARTVLDSASQFSPLIRALPRDIDVDS